MKYKVVSLDMFGTLVDVATRRYDIWQHFLKNNYSVELADEYWRRANEILFQCYHEISLQNTYISPIILFEMCYSRLFPEIGIDFNPREAAAILARQHSLSSPFTDTIQFLDLVGKEFPICLSSDTDDNMLGKLKFLYNFDTIFTSEQIGSYKTGTNSRFFNAVIDHYGIDPKEIIHIGDSVSDVIGANSCGIVSCWLNRNNQRWNQKIKPDYEVRSLIQGASILGIEIKGN